MILVIVINSSFLLFSENVLTFMDMCAHKMHE